VIFVRIGGTLVPGRISAMADASTSAERFAAALVELATHSVTAVGLLGCEPSGSVDVLAASDAGCRLLLEGERRFGSGPGLSAIRSAAWFEVHDLTAEDSAGTAAPGGAEVAPGPAGWLGWRAAAVATGWVSVVAIPLIPTGRHETPPIGALVLPSRTPGPMDLPVQAWALAFAAAAAAGWDALLSLRRERLVTVGLQQALDSRVVIEQAKGVLVERGGLDPATAFDRLRRYARAHREQLADVARRVLDGGLADDVLTHARPLDRPGRD
jgi:hypothetical protein